MKIRNFALVLAVSGSAFTMYACGAKKPPPAVEPQVDLDAGKADAEPPPPPPKKSLYDRLGGKEAIKAVVDKFVTKVQADAKVKALFAKTTGKKLDTFKDDLVNQLCKDSGGDCQSAGKAMADALKGAKVSDEHFDAIVADLKGALGELKVPDEDQADLLAIVDQSRTDLVNVKKPAPKK